MKLVLFLNLSNTRDCRYPDMMEVGNFNGHDPLRFNEERTHFGLWCIVSSPLVLGFNLSDSVAMDRVWPVITNTEGVRLSVVLCFVGLG